MATSATSTEDRVREQRRALPDAPGVYIFRDAKGKVLYVGKARSIRKRVAGHFSKAGARGFMQLMPATAKEIAKKLGLAYSKARLTTDGAELLMSGSFKA